MMTMCEPCHKARVAKPTTLLSVTVLTAFVSASVQRLCQQAPLVVHCQVFCVSTPSLHHCSSAAALWLQQQQL
jgi:hypothetical protein